MRALLPCLALVLAAPAAAEPVAIRYGKRAIALATAPEPRERVVMTAHGRTHAYEGAPLHLVLMRVGAPLGGAMRGEALRHVVIVTGRDGYAAVLSLAEVDPGLGGRRVILADRADGRPLGDDDGPWRLVVEDDRRPTRSVRQVARIEVRAIAP